MKRIGAEYARALYDLAAEQDVMVPVKNGLDAVVSVLEQDPDAPEFLVSPAIPGTKKTELIRDAFGERCGIHPHVTALLEMLVEKGRMRALFEIKEEFDRLYHTLYMAVKKVRIVSAHPLTEEQKQSLIGMLSRNLNCKMEPRYEIDPGVLGGMYLEIDQTVIDGTLATRLKQAKEVMKQ